MTHIELLATVRLPVHAAGCDILDAQDNRLDSAGDAPTAKALAKLINLGESAAVALDEAYHTQQQMLTKAGVGKEPAS